MIGQMTDVRVAFIIMAHEDPPQFKRLVQALMETGQDMYVHIDAKAPLDAFEAVVPDGAKVRFIRERCSIAHGGYSLTLAVMNMLHWASDEGDYDMYQMLSGIDYPIKSAAEIMALYDRDKHANFITTALLDRHSRFARNVYNYHFVDQIAGMPAALRPAAHRAKKLVDMLPPRRLPKGMVLCRGASSCALSHTAVTRVLRFLKTTRGRRWRRFFRFSWGSDEIMLHTVMHYLGMGCEQRILHYIDWSPEREDPAILDMRDYDALMASDALFARKFKTDTSDALIDKLS